MSNTHNTVNKPENNLFSLILCLLVIIGIGFLFWPGYMSPDSITQLNQGLTGSYSDHHPPMMSFFWRLFSYVHTGPELYLIFHLCLLFFSVYILQTIVKQRWLKYAIALIPLAPAIASYSGALWKDVGFAYAFLLAGTLLTKSNMTGQTLTYPKMILILLLLIYGVGIKYQAQFVLPVMGLWFGLTLTHAKFNLKAILTGTAITMFVLLFVLMFNKTLVPVEKEQHSWQMVKLYDLAGISLRMQKNLFPDFITSDTHFSMEKVKTIYSPERVDELIYNWYESGPFVLTHDEKNLGILWSTWANAVMHHPMAYLSHRFSVWYNMISKSAIKPLEALSNTDKIPSNIKVLLQSSVDIVFWLVQELSRFSWMLPLLLIYLCWGFRLYKRNNPYGLALLMMNLSALSLLLCLFIFSMAADIRYIYLSACFLCFSHLIALAALLDKQQERTVPC